LLAGLRVLLFIRRVALPCCKYDGQLSCCVTVASAFTTSSCLPCLFCFHTTPQVDRGLREDEAFGTADPYSSYFGGSSSGASRYGASSGFYGSSTRSSRPAEPSWTDHFWHNAGAASGSGGYNSHNSYNAAGAAGGAGRPYGRAGSSNGGAGSGRGQQQQQQQRQQQYGGFGSSKWHDTGHGQSYDYGSEEEEEEEYDYYYSKF
jgi:hypothetical protein